MASHPVWPDTRGMERKEDDVEPGTRRFRIWVQGRLEEGFSDGLIGIEQEDVPAGTVLGGSLRDQSQLYGTLDLLRSLGIDVLRFEVDPPHRLDNDEEKADERSDRLRQRDRDN